MAAERSRHTLGEQSETVTTIASAVDETAHTADSMSQLIAAIRVDFERFADDQAEVQLAFSIVNDDLTALNLEAKAMIKRILSVM